MDDGINCGYTMEYEVGIQGMLYVEGYTEDAEGQDHRIGERVREMNYRDM